MNRQGKYQKPRRTAAKTAGLKNPAWQQREQVRLDTLGSVAAVLSHESRNLLGALGTCVQVLRRNPHLSADDSELLDIVQAGANRLSEIVGQFAMFRRAQPADFAALDPHELIDQTLTKLRQDDRCSPLIAIERQFDPAIDGISVDATQLRQILWQLFLNAAQAMGAQGTLTVRTERTGREILIQVSDTGPGIPPEVRRRIFEPLYSTKTRGAGLGLTIVKRFVEQHGGRIAVASADGKGTSFTIRLPIEQMIKQSAPADARFKNGK